LLGSNLVRELLLRGHEVRVLIQKGRAFDTLKGLDIVKVEGDLLDYESLQTAAGKPDLIYHAAASTSIWPVKSELINKVNIEGTKNILRLSFNLNINKLIHVGTANTFGFGTKEDPGNENRPYMGKRYGLGYMDSKWEAHQLVEKSVEEGLPALIVNPTFLVGPFDSVPNSGTMILAVYNNKIKGYTPGGRNYICVKDAVIGMANAMEKGEIGESYIIGNENLSYKEAFIKIASVLGVEPPNKKIPKWAVLAFGRFSSFRSAITGKKPIISYPMAKISCDDHYFSAEKAIRELNLPQTPIEEGILESFEWMKENGYL